MGDPFELEEADFDEPPRNYLTALMFFPENAKRRAELLRAMRSEGLERGLKEIPDDLRDLRLPLDMHLAMVDYARRWKGLEQEVVEPLRGSKGMPGPGHGGEVAAMTLVIPLVNRLKFNRPYGRGEAYRIIAKLAGPGAPGVSERTLKSNWMKYRAASHVWAAACLRPNLMSEPEGLAEFTAFAQQIRIDAAEYTPPHAAEPLLPLDVSADLDMIRLPDTARQRGFPRWIDQFDWPPEVFGD